MKLFPDLKTFFATHNTNTPLTEAELIQYLTQGLKILVNDTDLYIKALTHKSYKNKKSDAENNERLEFLGDAVIELYVSEYLIQNFPAWNEGELTQARKCIVCRKTLNAIAQQHLALDRVLRHSLKENPHEQKDIFGNALEALVGALLLDHQQETTLIRNFIRHHIISPAINLLVEEKNIIFQSNAQPNAQPKEQPKAQPKKQAPNKVASWKSQLNLFCQEHKIDLPVYEVKQASNGQSLHMITATIKAKNKNMKKVAQGQGKKKKDAENQAAKEILKYFQNEPQHIKDFA